ncbi:MAG: flagellar motor switch phosphatase FliY [bacterium]|jgi:flagellar motor switch protein FliN/FliY
MGNDILSQAEIDLLLTKKTSSGTDRDLSEAEKDTIGEIGNISLGAGATTLSALLGQPVQITTPHVSLTTRRTLAEDYPIPCVAVEVAYSSGLAGSNLLVIIEDDVRTMVDLMMGGDGNSLSGELDDLHFSAISEAMNQMMGAAATAMSTMFKTRINISPPTLETINMATVEPHGVLGEEEPLIKIAFRMTIGSLVDSEIIQLMPYDFGRQAIRLLMQQINEAQALDEAASAAPDEAKPKSGGTEPKPAPAEKTAAAEPAQARPMPRPPAKREMPEDVLVQSAVFQPLRPSQSEEKDDNLNLILDVPLTLTVELGRTNRQIKDILKLGIGSVVELDKLAGEPVEVLVNGKLIAKGEVVVIDENFGVRITEIVSVLERVTNLQ